MCFAAVPLMKSKVLGTFTNLHCLIDLVPHQATGVSVTRIEASIALCLHLGDSNIDEFLLKGNFNDSRYRFSACNFYLNKISLLAINYLHPNG